MIDTLLRFFILQCFELYAKTVYSHSMVAGGFEEMS
jgi:hypothetical protein